MGEYAIKLPDVGEGVAEAELVEWNFKVGDAVREDDILGAVMTDKATVEIPSPVEGTVKWLGAEIGDTVAVGSPIVRLDVSGDGNVTVDAKPREVGATEKESSEATPTPGPSPQGGGEEAAASGTGKSRNSTTETVQSKPAKAEDAPKSPSPLWGGVRGGGRSKDSSPHAPRPEGEKPLASPAVRLRAREAGIDLRRVPGSGPAGRIGHDDLDAFMKDGAPASAGRSRSADTSLEEIKVVGLRRRIAERMQTANEIPHIAYVEEVDVTELEELRGKLNREKSGDHAKLTMLPFLMLAMVRAIREQPQLNAHFDAEAGIIRRSGGIHIGMAAQTASGLMVPVVRHAEARDLWDCAAEIGRLAEAAKSGTASRDELSGSTITITSLGAMGGIVTTPIINYPEVAIVGVNKIATRPMWNGTVFIPRRMMNLSSSFDHRVIDGWDAAVFIQRIKVLMETPALIFVEG